MMTKQLKFVLAVVLQTAVIFAIIIFKLSILAGGTEVLLKIAPVDPRDLLRGDYATFQYDISNVATDYLRDEVKNGDTVYVLLRQSGKYWVVREVQKYRPAESTLSGAELFIKGKVESGGQENQSALFLPQRFGDSRLHIVYGIEQYFIPEGAGRGVSFANKEASAKVAIDDNGNPALKQIYVNDKVWP